MKKHKHAEVLRAIAERKAVECYEWREKSWGIPLLTHTNPLNNPELEWRIKPEPKPPIVNSTHIHLNGEVDWWSYNDYQTPNIRFTFDPDTKLPIKVELI